MAKLNWMFVFQNGTRQLKTLDITWVPANSRKIQESVEKVAGLVTGGRNVIEAYEALFGASIAVPEASESASSLLIQVWELFEAYKIRKNLIKESTWSKDYATSGKRLKELLDANDTFDLLGRTFSGSQDQLYQVHLLPIDLLMNQSSLMRSNYRELEKKD